jgi:hypothetical protein
MSVIELDELVEVISGIVVSRIECKNEEKIGTLNVLTLKAISAGKIDTDYIQSIDIFKRVAETKLTQQGDIIMKLNTPYDSVYIEKEHENLLVPSFCCLIRGGQAEIINPYYLVGYLNSSFAKEYLHTSNSSSAASLLKIRDIRKLPIPLPRMAEQLAVGDVFKVCTQRQLILAKIMEQEMCLANNIVMDSVREVFKR